MPSAATAPNHRLLTWGVLLSVLLLGFLLRVTDLTGAPVGISGDELFYYDDARLIMRGQFPVYFPNNYGHEPLFQYLQAGFLRLIGPHAYTLRYTAVFVSMLGLAVSYALGKRLFRRRVGLSVMALFATLFWSLFLGRIGLRVSTYPVLAMFSIYAFWRALQDRSWRWTIAAGILNGLTMYTYVASRVFPGVIIGWLLILVVLNRSWLRSTLRGNGRRISVFGALAALVWLPLLIYSVQNPDLVNQRLVTMGGPFYSVQQGDFSGLLTNLGAVAGMFNVRGDPDARYNPDARPVFEPLTGLIFLIGVLVALRRFRQPAYSLLFVWLGVTLLPTLLAPDAPAFLRASGAIFPTYALAGVGLDWLLTKSELRVPGAFTPRRLVVSGLCGAIALAALNFTALYGAWRTSPLMMKVYGSDMYFAARYLNDNPPPPEASVVIVTAFAEDNAQRIFRLQDPQRHRVRWTKGMLWPASTGETWYLFSQDSLPDERVRTWLGTEPVHTEMNNAGQPVLEVYRLPARPALPQPDIPFEARFDRLVDLIGVSYSPLALRGQSATIDLFWRVRPDLAFDPGQPPGVRVRLQSASGIVWAEDADRTALPAAQWQTGDVWVQRLKLDLPPNMPPSSIQPELAIVTDQGLWPALSGSATVAKPTVALPPLTVTGRPAPFDPPAAPQAVFADQLALLETGMAASATPGSPLFIGTTWQALRDLDQDYALQLQLLKSEATSVAVVTQTLWAGVYPTHNWRTGERITSNDPLTVPVDVEAGAYGVQLRLIGANGPLGNGAWMPVGNVEVSGRPHQFAQPPIDVAVDASFGDVAKLIGYRLDRTNAQPGGQFVLTLIWQAQQPTSASYKVFTHVYNAQHAVVGQHDSLPAGNAPTSSWLTGEYIVDPHVLPIDPAASGPLRLGVGLYHAETLQRLPAFAADGTRLPDDVVIFFPDPQ
jgi:4-amino-4-deoxy-L-arabinose transferase-like glycosyltransferase